MKTLQAKVSLAERQVADLFSTLQSICHLLSIEAPVGHSKRITIIQRVVIDHFRLPPNVMSSRVKTKHYVEGRHVALYLCRQLTRHTLEDIGAAFRPGMDHTTVTNATQSVQERMQVEPAFLATVNKLQGICTDQISKLDMPLFAYNQLSKVVA